MFILDVRYRYPNLTFSQAVPSLNVYSMIFHANRFTHKHAARVNFPESAAAMKGEEQYIYTCNRSLIYGR